MEAWAARPAPCDPHALADRGRRPSARLLSGRLGRVSGPHLLPSRRRRAGRPHDQDARGQQPGGDQGQQVAGGAGKGRLESATDGRRAERVVTGSPAPPSVPGVSPEVPGMPEVPVDPGVPVMPSVSVEPPGSVVPGGGAMIPPVLVSAAQATEASPSRPAPLPQTVTGTDGETSPTSTAACLPEAIRPVSRTPMPAGA